MSKVTYETAKVFAFSGPGNNQLSENEVLIPQQQNTVQKHNEHRSGAKAGLVSHILQFLFLHSSQAFPLSISIQYG